MPVPASYRQASVSESQARLPHGADGELTFASAVRHANVQSQAEGAATATLAQFACGDGPCHCGSCPEPGCAVFEPGCGVPEPGCGFPEPGCAVMEPPYGPEPGCAIADPGCGFVTEGEACGDCLCGDVACCGDCVGGHCPPPCFGGCAERGAIPICIWLPPIKEIVLFGGVHGFKNPLDNMPDRRDAGNFGFHEGVNVGGRMAWLPWPGLGFQVGYQAVHSQLSGSTLGPYSSSHTQNFFTTGLFRRRPVGIQYGVVYDFLQDERQGSADFNQVRGLISTTSQFGHEFGFQFTARGGDITVTNGGATSFTVRDQYLFFYRYHGQTGGEFRWFIGGNDSHHTILGGDLNAPLNERWSIQTGATYFIPSEDGSSGFEADEEGWNVGINLVWHYGARGRQYYKSPWRPLFNVADNGSMFVDDVD